MANKRRKRIGPHHAPAGRFTGTKGSDSKKRQKTTHKQRKKNRHTHVSKYKADGS